MSDENAKPAKGQKSASPVETPRTMAETAKPDAPKAAPAGPIAGPTMIVTRKGENMIREGADDLAGQFSEEVGKPCYAVLAESCPLDSVSFGKITFHKRTFKRGQDGEQLMQRGQAVTITESEQKWLERDLRTRVLRVTSYDPKGDGNLTRMGQQDIARAHWVRDGDAPPRGVGEVNPGDVVLAREEGLALIRNADYAPRKGDHTFHKYVSLVQITREAIPTLNMLGVSFQNDGQVEPEERVNAYEDAKALNSLSEDEAEALLTAQGRAQRASQTVLKEMRLAGSAGRE